MLHVTLVFLTIYAIRVETSLQTCMISHEVKRGVLNP